MAVSAIMLEDIPREAVYLLLAIGGVAAALIVLFWITARLRRYLENSSGPLSGPGWTIGQIRKLHRSGELTDKQYQALREVIIKDTRDSESGGRPPDIKA